jgi:retinol dehydrogenase 12
MPADRQSMSGKTVLITGANSGVGSATATRLAALGARVIFGCRSEDRTRPVMTEIAQTTGNAALEFLPLDLADLDSVAAAAARVLSNQTALDVLILNAGVAGQRGTTAQHFERSFGVNHLGHMLLTLLLQPALRVVPSRVVVVSSRAHESSRRLDLTSVREPQRSVTGLAEYERSKLCNMLFAAELRSRWQPDGVGVWAIHPGTIASDIWREVPAPARWLMTRFMSTPEEGARASIECASATHPPQELYVTSCSRPRRPSPLVHDLAVAAELWNRSLWWLAPWLGAAGLALPTRTDAALA